MYSAIDNSEQWVLPRVLDEQAQRLGDQPAVSIVGGETLSYRSLRDQAAQVAGMLRQTGLRPGDRIAVMLPNGLEDRKSVV